ncbi:hypothetical protein PR202_ga29101 [Eleusine coracana subsp. coracana]|uniref:Uncharacterized protein n=1 Tax=Eleusine coracana subsp. coracana TaxID=191504 RepID=A0AAV5DKI5_ELECO|nr:hypothetical protein PR202_ga29101 [Eleusine coracana subsp. coracana]
MLQHSTATPPRSPSSPPLTRLHHSIPGSGGHCAAPAPYASQHGISVSHASPCRNQATRHHRAPLLCYVSALPLPSLHGAPTPLSRIAAMPMQCFPGQDATRMVLRNR